VAANGDDLTRQARLTELRGLIRAYARAEMADVEFAGQRRAVRAVGGIADCRAPEPAGRRAA